MAESEQELLWTTFRPAAWPDAPDYMTVTTLAEIEACPRRWALGSAHYPAIWTGRGYPPRIQTRAIAGTVIHLSLEKITKGLVRTGCPSVQDPSAIQVMKELGGYTKVANDSIDQVLESLVNNPRGKPLLEFVARFLRSQVPELRTRAQAMLCRVRLPQIIIKDAGSHASKRRRALSMGVFPEIKLHARQIGWKGRADLLILSPDACEIVDFKTGEPDDKHRFQIQVYALLWSRDVELNPNGNRADRLVLAYSGGDVEVPAPTEQELEDLESHLVDRRDAAHEAVSRHPPEARPDPGHCRYCGVRQLCSEYWTVDVQRRIAEKDGDRRFADIELTITGRHGPSSWDAQVELSRDTPAGKIALLRSGVDATFHSGDRVRVLDAGVAVDGEDDAQPVVITLGGLSETFTIP